MKHLLFTIFIVATGSMSPAIKEGSLVFVREYENYDVGDIITYKLHNVESRTVTHRIIKVLHYDSEKLYETQGDANSYADVLPVAKDEIVGKVFLFIPYLGYVVDAVYSPLLVIVFFYIPIGYFIGRLVLSA